MTKMIDLGSATEVTKGTEFHSLQLDAAGVKIIENGVKYRTAPEEQANGVRAVDPA